MQISSMQYSAPQEINFDHFVERNGMHYRAMKNRARKMANIGRAMQLGHKDGTYAIIHPRPDGKTGWQISRFDHFGPCGDSRRATYYDVALLAIEENFCRVIEIDAGIQ